MERIVLSPVPGPSTEDPLMQYLTLTCTWLLLAMLWGAATAAAGASREQVPQDFAAIDTDASGGLSKQEARDADALLLLASWQTADANQNHRIDPAEYRAFVSQSANKAASAETRFISLGTGQFKAPETALWDEKRDVYLVSNVNGPLTAKDDNGFISRVSPDGNIEQLRWIDGADPDVTLHAPKDMTFWNGTLAVADATSVRLFDPKSGKPLGQHEIEGAFMLNALTTSEDGRHLYVSDTGSPLTGEANAGAVYQLSRDGSTRTIATGAWLERPNGIVWQHDRLMVAPFGAEADTLYELTPQGERRNFATVPRPQLDGLIQLPDGSFVVTSWQGNAIYQLSADGEVTGRLVTGVPSPAQIGYDAKRSRLLVPVLHQNVLRIHSVNR